MDNTGMDVAEDALELLGDYDLDGMSQGEVDAIINDIATETIGTDSEYFDELVAYLQNETRNRVKGVDTEFYKEYGGY